MTDIYKFLYELFGGFQIGHDYPALTIVCFLLILFYGADFVYHKLAKTFHGSRKAAQYQVALRNLEKNLRHESDGTVTLTATGPHDLGVDDPAIYYNIKRSIDETNQKIQNKETYIGREWTFSPSHRRRPEMLEPVEHWDR